MNERERGRVAALRVARLATIDGVGRPRLVPFCFVLDADVGTDVIWSAVDELKPKSSMGLARLEDVRSRSDVTVLFDHYEEDWSRLWWVRARGAGSVVPDAPRARQLLCEKYAQYDVAPPPGPFLRIEVAEWRSWDGGRAAR